MPLGLKIVQNTHWVQVIRRANSQILNQRRTREELAEKYEATLKGKFGLTHNVVGVSIYVYIYDIILNALISDLVNLEFLSRSDVLSNRLLISD